MRVIGLRARTLLLLVAGASLALADPHSDIVNLLGNMAANLANDNPAGFMAGFDKTMPDYDKLRASIDALVAEAQITSEIEPVKDEGDDARRSVDLDWTMQIRSRVMAGPLVQREQIVRAEFVKEKKHWRIVAVRPLEFFAPAKFSPSQ